jgi:N-methylhydantoinase B
MNPHPGASQSAGAVDPITLEVVRNGIYAVAEEMKAILMRSARAPLLKEAGDLSCILTDARGRLIAQGRDIPVHLGVVASTGQEFLKRVPPETLGPGDQYVTNALEVGGNHLPDVKLIKPIFAEDRLVAFAINLAHWPDVGGATPGSYVPWATEIYQEGLQIPPIRLFSAQGVERPVLDLILANTRGRDEREGDVMAQYACNEVAARRLLELFGRYGARTVTACFDRFLAESEALMRAEIARVPDGVYEGEDRLDDDGVGDRPLTIRVRVEVRGEALCFDFAGTDPQCPGPLNTTPFVTRSAVYYACKALLGPDIPMNDGCLAPLEVRIPLGTLLNPRPGAPVVGGNHETSARVVDAVFRALARAVPDRIVAGGVTTAVVLVLSGRGGDGRSPYLFYEVHGGGEGAGATHDGDNGLRVHLSNTMNTPAEAIEAAYPVRVEAAELIPGSGGAGRHRGGLGLRRRYRVLVDSQAVTMIDRCRFAPWGAFGGGEAMPCAVTLDPETPAARPARGKGTFPLRAGQVIEVRTAGGGGYGPAGERDPALVERDRLYGYV